MTNDKKYILTINVGSSSIKFALYHNEEDITCAFYGKIDRIGSLNAHLSFVYQNGTKQEIANVKAVDHNTAANILIDFLVKQPKFKYVNVISHRVVHGMNYSEATFVTTKLLEELKSISSFVPNHLPNEIELIEIFKKRYPDILQVACFDTAFHAKLPRLAQIIPLPRKLEQKGIRKYGFHGISYTFLLGELARIGSIEESRSKVIFAHLGNDSSLVAVEKGKSIDTSMSFTPAAGLPMGTRSGDIDPGIVAYIMETEKISPHEFDQLINNKSGLIGISGTSSDMRDLLKFQKDNIHASEAINFFCYQVRKWIGAYATVLGGLDTLVFSGGIGENLPDIRNNICQNLQFLGIELQEKENSENANIISSSTSRVKVRVIPTDEEHMIAEMAYYLMKKQG